MNLFHALSSAAVLVAAAIALLATLGAWRRRSATPRTASLAAACAACIGLALTAIDEPISAQWLCTERRLPPDATEPPSDTTKPLDERLRGVLAQWSWWVRPCGRLDVTVAEADLVTPIHLGELVDLASRTRVAVDVRLPTGMPSPGEVLALTMQRRETDKPLVLPMTTPIPLSYADMVKVQLAESLAECQIDDGRFSRGHLAHLLADAALSKDDRLGFHRLRCKRGDAPNSFVSAYVQIVSTGVVFASSDEGFVAQQRRDIGRTGACATPAACLGLRPERTRSLALEVPTVVPEEEAPTTASMLVLDRPRTARSCDLTHRLLNLGATVVVAMPEDGFFSATCEQWFPVARKSGAEGWVFDRAPRLTFVFDDGFEAGLDSTPSAVIEATDPCGPITKLQGSRGDQRHAAEGLCEAAKSVAPDVRCSSWGHAAGDDQRFPEPAAQDDGRGDCTAGGDPERLACSAPDGATKRFAAELSERRESWENEVLVVFTHDHRPFELRGAALAARTQVVRIDDPYGFSLSRVFHQPVIADLPLTPEIVVDAEARALSDVKGAEEVRCDSRSVPILDERRLDVFSAVRQARAEFMLGAEESTRFPRRHERATTPAPMRLGWWDQPGAPRGPRIEDTTVELARMPRTEGIVERTLAVGAMVGPGHLLFLAYSPFAERREDSSVLDGLRMLEDIYDATEDFIGKVHSEVLSVTPRPDGALWIAVARDIDVAALDVDGLRVQPSGGSEFVAPLVDLAHDRGILTYALPAAELEKLERCVSIALPPVSGPSSRSTSAIWACPPDTRVDEGGRMAAVAALQQLAHFSGGRVLGPGDHVTPTSLRTRNFGLGLLTLSFLFAWSRRAVRRLGGVGTARRLARHERVAQRRYDPPDAVVAAAGDWDGRSTTWPRTGSFGGYRPIEPGDRAGAAVLADLLIRQLRGTELLPRVALRIEESAPAVAVLVNLGASMRSGGANGSGKATFGGRVALHVAASAWRIGGEVTIVAAGIEGESEVVAACRLGPDDDEVAHVLQRRLGQPAARHATPWPTELPECGALVYVSDYQHEDEEALHRWLVQLEAAGVRVGGVMIYSPQEFAMVEGGRLAGSGVWADRADWEPDDVFAAFGRRRDQIERIFDGATTGGLVVAATTYHPDDLEQALVGGRLLEILR